MILSPFPSCRSIDFYSEEFSKVSLPLSIIYEGKKIMSTFTKYLYLALLVAGGMNSSSAQWTQSTGFIDYVAVYALAPVPNGSGGMNLLATGAAGTLLSADNGQTWSTSFNTGGFAIAVSGTNLFLGGESGVFLSTNYGSKWTAVDSGMPASFYAWTNALTVSGANIFAGTFAGVYLSTNNGTSWAVTNLLPYQINALAVSGANVFAGTSSSGVFVSSNNGANWAQVKAGMQDTLIDALQVSGANLFAGTHLNAEYDQWGGVFISGNSGTGWSAANAGMPVIPDTNGKTVDYALPTVWSFAVSGPDIFAGTDHGVFHSGDNGGSWTNINDGLTDTLITALAVSGPYLCAGTNAGVWRRPLSQVTAVSESKSETPRTFSLSQNYPNPFNPSTVIQFTVPSNGRAVLKVFNVLGQEVATLYEGIAAAGDYHQATFDASRLASGVYFSRLEYDGKTQMKKMLLLK